MTEEERKKEIKKAIKKELKRILKDADTWTIAEQAAGMIACERCPLGAYQRRGCIAATSRGCSGSMYDYMVDGTKPGPPKGGNISQKE